MKCFCFINLKRTHISGVRSCPSHPKTAISKSRCLKQTLLCLHFINSLNSRVSLNYSCFKSIRRPHCSILFKRSPPKITMSSLFHWHATLSGASVYSFNGQPGKAPSPNPPISDVLHTHTTWVSMKNSRPFLHGMKSSEKSCGWLLCSALLGSALLWVCWCAHQWLMR